MKEHLNITFNTAVTSKINIQQKTYDFDQVYIS